MSPLCESDVRLSLVVITYQEAENLRRCIESVGSLADEVLVVDSFSTDGTQQLARRLGARVLEHPFDNYADQKIWAISQATHPWILSLDADEALSPDLRQSILRLKGHYTAQGYYMNRLSRLGHRWIRHGAWYPDRKMRLFHRDHYQMGGGRLHERFEPRPGATTHRLDGDLLHYTNDSLESRIDTQRKFSQLAAEAYFEKGKRGSLWRVWIKPPGRFLSEYLWKDGWQDGFYGYFIAKTSAQYVFWRESRLYELSRYRADNPPPTPMSD